MSDQQASRFTAPNKTTNERLSTHTVGLVALSDFRKRRAAVLEQQEREAREAALSGTSKPDRSLTGTPDNAGSDSAGSAGPGLLKKKKLKKKSKQNPGKKLLSFGDDDADDDTENASGAASETPSDKDGPLGEKKTKTRFKANAAVGLAPKAVTKAALLKEVAERDALRREFVALQESIKDTDIAIPFVFYDGASTPGGTVRMKKGDFIWVFLDKSRKVGAELGVGEQANSTRAWARVGVDDLMLVRGTVIIPHVSVYIIYSSILLFSLHVYVYGDANSVASIMTFIISSSTRAPVPEAFASSTTAPKHRLRKPRPRLQLQLIQTPIPIPRPAS